MIDRRTLFGATAAVGSVLGAVFGTRGAQAKTNFTTKNLAPPGDVEKRGAKGRLERLPDLDLESKWDFFTGFRNFHKQFTPIASKRVDRILEARGMDRKTEMTIEEAVKLVEDDLLVQTSGRTWVSNQFMTWKIIKDYFHAHADEYLAEYEAADKDGPGTLDLNPDLDIPDYARREFHIQPGGYVGDPFAGHIFHYGSLSFTAGNRLGQNLQDELQNGIADRMPLPRDGKVRRILDMGCGTGRYTMGLKERFPDAEVWGIDVAGPLLRYAHMRGRDLDIAVHWSQQSAEETNFEDGYFDIVTSYIINHEITSEGNKKIVAEAYRLTRPGGYYYPIDFRTRGDKGRAYQQYRRWWDHRWNEEPWSPEFVAYDFEGEIEKAGFTINRETKPVMSGWGARHAEKLA